METVVKTDTSVLKGVPKVAIIGAGVSGLISARHLKDIAHIKVYESKQDIGGCWLYTEESERNHPDLDSNAYYKLYGNLHSSLYHNLLTNIPKECMTWKDHYHHEDTPYIMPSETFLEYIREYVDKFELTQYIEFNRAVTSLRRVEETEENSHKFKIEHVHTNTKEESEVVEEYFDYVMVCNGHFSTPKIPDFKGKDNFKGFQMHMHELRKMEPEDFDDKNVLIVGSCFSAHDLVINILFREDTKDLVHPKKVFITSRSTTLLEKSEDYKDIQNQNLLEIKSGNIDEIKEDSVVFGDGSEEQIDTIIYATGYKYSFPFIDPDQKIVEFDSKGTNGSYFGPLYKKMFCINEPNIFFIGVVERILIIHSTYERQILLAKEVIQGKITLPSKQEMLEDLASEIENHEKYGKDLSYFYRFNPAGYTYADYNKDLEALTSMEIDTTNYSALKPANEARSELMKAGNEVQIKNIDYSEYLDGIEFKPTSSTF
ncbi:unnamed protein product [Moneuplotes crassus]|uniref:Flavin-containing monooxygenase n=1 Tax=Euplotes crassus TaxID=5936 RepID=A0AAD1XA85_EUPCR|nr:unnamed protein product [Moneuplotes crassus]